MGESKLKKDMSNGLQQPKNRPCHQEIWKDFYFDWPWNFREVGREEGFPDGGASVEEAPEPPAGRREVDEVGCTEGSRRQQDVLDLTKLRSRIEF